MLVVVGDHINSDLGSCVFVSVRFIVQLLLNSKVYVKDDDGEDCSISSIVQPTILILDGR